MELGKRIKNLRAKRGITQEALAGALGVTAQTVSKWENEITMPDIALLPELSIFFGITIDELFSLSAENQMERIDNRIAEAELISDSEAAQMEETLREIGKENAHKGKAYTILAYLHNHQAEVHRRIAAEFARTAMEAEPENSDAISEFTNAMGTYLPDWNVRNHHELIAELKEFTVKHPESLSASMWLLDNLMADGRFAEAEKEIKHLEKVDDTFRIVLYQGLLAKEKGNKEEAEACFRKLEEKYSSDWMVQMVLGDLMTCDEAYDRALAFYRKAMEQQPAPKFTDAPEAMAHIYEILGQKQNAIDAYMEALRIMKDDWGMLAGEEVEKINRCIKRLVEK